LQIHPFRRHSGNPRGPIRQHRGVTIGIGDRVEVSDGYDMDSK